jgi:hypothetical protein
VVGRGLRDPVRTLPEAVDEITARLESEFDAQNTTLLRYAPIERLVLLQIVSMNHGASAEPPPSGADLL